jgi:hypothetical protein
MKTLRFASILLMGSASLWLCASCTEGQNTETSGTTDTETAVETDVSPETLFENDYISVYKIKLAPGALLPTHDGGNRLIYSLSDYSIDWTEQGEAMGTKSWKAGDVHYHHAGSHAAKNNGTTPAEWLVFARKDAELPDCESNTMEEDVSSVAPEYAQTRYNDQGFKATLVSLPGGALIPAHSGVNRVIYSLSDYQVQYWTEQEDWSEKRFAEGDVHWHEACQHSLRNMDEAQTNAEFLIVALY